MKPSFLQTVVKQSMEPDMSPEVTVTAQPRRKDRPRLPLSPTRIGFRVSKIPTAEMVKPLYRPWIPSDLRVLT